MLTMFSQQTSRSCDQVSRREFLRAGGLGLGGFTMVDMLRWRAMGAVDDRQRAKSVIVVFLAGGPSHIDMYDLKPDAPAEIRGEFQPIETNVPGLRVCELMPRHATIADKFSVVNGVEMLDTHSAWVVMTGFGEREKRPVFGSYISRIRGSSVGGMPTYVSLRGENGADPGEPAWLGAAHRPFTPSGEGMSSLQLSREISTDRFDERRGLLRDMDRLPPNAQDQLGNVAGFDGFRDQALEIIRSPKTRTAFDISQEPKALQDAYGPAKRLLQARRLVEAGVPVVTLSMAGTICPPGDWDTHAGTDQKSQTNFYALRQKLPIYDKAIHTLITDLHDRGLDKDVLLVVHGEFGRTPKINKFGGRDHWAPASSVLFSGGGLQMGQVVGDTGPRAERAVDTNYSGQNILATIYRHLGIDLETKLNDLSGRPRYLLDDTRPIRELI
ncbi:hypothetical protein ETAA8_17040 [Anatilimnocola aggregata]|uniref:DUF1501 domain-containing protein n=2 Tax=Anatilimnocola aggregata TaxID=2528021 RepID=A0A517Y8Q7_9BACT|nr:hypothetical protein ETAA8_17040 [Anatilimnocola aggregata]